jgi:hypothetical protein
MPEACSLFAAVVAVLWGLAPAAAWHQEMGDYPTTCVPSTPGSTPPQPAPEVRRDA